eukprot:Nitzschia sp. Nitz4//scaffold5_size260463//97440//98663//NITZ4_000972-RA/size260463-processed-gene-0.377-mRNA-1//-1//CDS//3329555310//1585//frame0
MTMESPGRGFWFEGIAKDSNLLLNIPFYVYEDLAWENATFGPYAISELASTLTVFRKHSDDYWLMKAALQHPMRTRDPSKAKLFFVPTLLNFYAFRSSSKLQYEEDMPLCWNNICDNQLLSYITDALLRQKVSPNGPSYIEKYPEHHLVVLSHFFARETESFWNTSLTPFLRKLLYPVNVIRFEMGILNNPSRLRLSKLYVGNPCQNTALHKEQDVAMIATIPKPGERRGFLDRRIICESIRWYNARQEEIIQSNTTGSQNLVRMTHCGGRLSLWGDDTGVLEQCPALAQAKFGFHVRGDSWGSSRLFDTILSGTVPIFTRKQQYPPIIPDWIDWNELSFFLDMTNVTTRKQFVDKLLPILVDEQGYQQRQQAVKKYQHLFDHTTLYPFDRYMYELQRYYYERDSSR